jgi:hypothetical protein
MELVDGFLGASGSILNVVFVWRSEADKVKLLGWVLRAVTSMKRRNVTVGPKDSLNFFVSHIGG